MNFSLFLILTLFLSISLEARAFNPICSSHFLPNVQKRSLAEISELNIATYNVLNLTKSTGRYQTINGRRVFVSGNYDKPVWQQIEIAKAIKETNLDIIVLQEVEGLDALKAFNETHLDNAYHAICEKGNDPRGIEIAFLVKKDLPISISMDFHKDLSWPNPLNAGEMEPLFSRDLPVMKIYMKDTSQRGPPDMILIGTHFKSQRGIDGDPTSATKREAQAAKTAEIIRKLKVQHGGDTPILLAGDFNAHVTKPEFAPLSEDNLLVDALEAKEVPVADRVTQTFHPRGGETQYSQLDAIKMTPNFTPYLKEASVYRYKDAQGNVKKIPETFKEREKNPSDHFMVRVVVDLKKFLGL